MSEVEIRRGPGRPRKNPLGGPQAGTQAPALLEVAKESLPAPHPKAPRVQGEDERCARCRYFRSTKKPPNAGSCFRYPPVPGFGDFVHPIVLESSWCGEFVERLAEMVVPEQGQGDSPE